MNKIILFSISIIFFCGCTVFYSKKPTVKKILNTDTFQKCHDSCSKQFTSLVSDTSKLNKNCVDVCITILKQLEE